MKIRRIIIASAFSAFAIFGTAAPASAGLWCETADKVDPYSDPGLAGPACRAALGAFCTVVGKVSGNNDGTGCLG
jgi:hypothetical protein